MKNISKRLFNCTSPVQPKDYLLIKFCCDYADEFDVEGFTVYSKEEWKAHKQHLFNCRSSFPVKWYFGSNEEIEFDTPEFLLSCLRLTEITLEQSKTIRTLFRRGSYGHLPMLYIKEENGELEDWEL